MKKQTLVCNAAAIVVVAFAAAGTAANVFAQANDTNGAVPGTGAAVLTDVGPLPAEDRDSHGAIVVDKRNPTAVMGNVGKPAQRVLDKAERDRQRGDSDKPRAPVLTK